MVQQNMSGPVQRIHTTFFILIISCSPRGPVKLFAHRRAWGRAFSFRMASDHDERQTKDVRTSTCQNNRRVTNQPIVSNSQRPSMRQTIPGHLGAKVRCSRKQHCPSHELKPSAKPEHEESVSEREYGCQMSSTCLTLFNLYIYI